MEPSWDYREETLVDTQGILVKRNGHPLPDGQGRHGLAALQVASGDAEREGAGLMKKLRKYAIYSPATAVLRGTDPETHPKHPVGLSGANLADALETTIDVLRKTTFDEDPDLHPSLYSAVYEDFIAMTEWAQEARVERVDSDLLPAMVPRTGNSLVFTDRFMGGGQGEISG